MSRALWMLICLAVPVVWGVLVNWLFDFWATRRPRRASEPEEPLFPDYQI